MKRRTMREGRQLVREYERSGESRAAFSERRGVGVATLDYWRRQVAAAGTGGLVEVEVKREPEVPAAAEAMTITWPCGVRVELEAGAATSLLLRRVHEVFAGDPACSR
jgi:transposase-like protein